ncbi:DUF6896 domain-containing protein [Flavobacterium defluvii]|uniref:DUF6896 domain-containing protein n=1 Tax=Flavobacterium defluvii TaxID=370979 RepID=A0A1M5PUS4_9FLAO|nr:hypothetical protein [Flavobacterium defluvii]SHH05625.1 hypothetical protein SAMN05443663_105132 [Flavobacterium defluvii]
MKRTTETIIVKSIDQIPSLEEIRKMPRTKTLKIIFENSVQNQRESVGQNFKNQLQGFQVGIHLLNPEINIAKLITDQEIEEHQLFFENCAKDYRKLGEKLIFKLAEQLKVTIDSDCPWITFNQFLRDNKQTGKLEEWRYFFHGFHCGFKNKKNGQIIEVPLVFSLEFGDLDPYFFTNFIKSTPYYKPLPVEIYEDYADGKQINDKMISLGKFERINSNFENHFGIVVKDREKVEIKEYKPEEHTTKRKFSFWKFIGIKF